MGVVVVHDDDVRATRAATLLVVRAEGLWAELLCETPGEHWSFGLEAFGVRFDDEAEAAASDRGERVAVGFDLEWETPDRVYGELLLGRAPARVRRDRQLHRATGLTRRTRPQSGAQRVPGAGIAPSMR